MKISIALLLSVLIKTIISFTLPIKRLFIVDNVGYYRTILSAVKVEYLLINLYYLFIYFFFENKQPWTGRRRIRLYSCNIKRAV